MSITPWKFQFDETGKDPKNLISSEAHTFSGPNHLAFPLNEGLFFTKSVRIKKQGSNDLLVAGTDYTFEKPDSWTTSKTGQSVAAVINFKDKSFAGTIEITYQCVGGAEGMPIGFMLDLIEALKKATENPRIDFKTGVINAPVYYPGLPHKHPWSSMEGTEVITQTLREITNAIINRIPMADSGNSYQEQIDRLIGLVGSMRRSINAIISVQGSASQLQDVIDQLAKLETLTTANVDLSTGETALIGEWDLETHNTVRGVISILAAGQLESMDFICQGVPGNTPTVTSYGILRSDNKILEISAVRVGTLMRVSVSSSAAGRVKAKVYAVL